MSLARPVVALILFWALIHGVYHFLKPSSSHSLLPSASVSSSRRRPGRWNTSSTQVVLKNVHLRVQTTAWNVRHDVFAGTLRRRRKIGWALTWFYDVGCLLGVLGMLVGFGVLVWMCAQAAYVLARKVLDDPAQPSLLAKRAIASHVPEPNLRQEYQSFIKPLIPGVTVPLGHLPLILTAVFLAQIVHEFGHVIAAALESLPILSAGAAFTLIIPSAFVTFPAAALEVLPPRARARIISAGPFHNLAFWAVLMLVQSLGVGNVLWSVGYKDVSDVGRVVVGVDVGSQLVAHLPGGSVISMLDDTPLGSVGASPDMWTSYLTGLDPDQGGSLGWCTERVLEKPERCCDRESTRGLACFVSGDSKYRGCLDPVPILTALEGGGRCTFDSDCTGNSTCVRPDGPNKLLRLTVHRPWSDGVPEVVLWSGSSEEIWEEVHVGNLLPRLGVVPIWLPGEAQLLWEYLLMGTLSLFFFNLLALPHLDGSQFLETILQIAFNNALEDALEYDIEALEGARDRRNPRQRGRWKERLTRGIPKVTIGLFALCILLGVINVLW